MNARLSRILGVLLAATTFAGCSSGSCDGHPLHAGPVTLSVHISRAASLFNLVDNASEWSEFCHRQYRKYLESVSGKLSERDLELLRAHAGVRSSLPWGEGLEQTFYTPLGLDRALEDGVSNGHLTPEQADIERTVLRHFASRGEALFNSQYEHLKSAQDMLFHRKADLTQFARTLSRFCGTELTTVPVYLTANPSRSTAGGGYNGNILTIEVARDVDMYPTVLHELCHAFLAKRESCMSSAVEDVDGLDYMTLNEGIAHALAPGIYRGDYGEDRLACLVQSDTHAGKTLDDSYARSYRFGLALRPLLQEALDDDSQTLGDFLPRAIDAWRVVVSLDRASHPRHRGWFVAGPGWQIMTKLPHRAGYVLSGNHTREFYSKALMDAAEGSTFFLLFALDHKDIHIPHEHQGLLPQRWSTIEDTLRQGKTFAAESRVKGLQVVVLAAPTMDRLKTLIETTALTHR